MTLQITQDYSSTISDTCSADKEEMSGRSPKVDEMVHHTPSLFNQNLMYANLDQYVVPQQHLNMSLHVSCVKLY